MIEKKPFWKRLIMFILDLPYTLLFDRITPEYIRKAFYTKSYKGVNRFCRDMTWRDYFFRSAGKKIVILGAGDAFWKIAKQERGMIECVIDWNKSLWGKQRVGVSIFSPDHLGNLAKTDKYVYLITRTNYIAVQTAITLLEEYGIHEYYSYANMECRRLRYIPARFAYGLKRFRTFLFNKDGFVPNCITFYLKMALCPILPGMVRASYTRLRQMKDRHKGQRCFIVATGPSLTLSDVEMLKDEITFGVNSIYRLFSQTDWRPTYYAMVDYKAVQNYKRDGEELDFGQYCKKEYFITDKICRIADISEHDNRAVTLLINYLDHMVYGENFHYKYRKNIARGIYNASTVVNSCINIAHYMGFSEIYLIGVDCNYSLPKQYFDNDVKNPLATDLEHAVMVQSTMQTGYAYYKKRMDEYGVKIFNATRGGMLEVFPRVTLENVMQEPAQGHMG